MKFGFTFHPVGPHLQPQAPVYKTVVEQGHEAFAVSSDKLARMAREYRMRLIPAGRDWTQDPGIRENTARLLLTQGNDAYNRELFTRLTNAARIMIPDYLEIFQREKPDVVIFDIADWAAHLAAKKLGIPAIPSDNGLLRLEYEMWDPIIRPIVNDIAADMGLPPEPEGIPASFQTVLHPLPKEILLPDLELPGLVTFPHRNPESIGARLPDGVFVTDQRKLVVMLGSSGSDVPQWEPIFKDSYESTIDAFKPAPGRETYDVFMVVGKGNVAKYADLPFPDEELGLRAVPARGAPNIMVAAHTRALPEAFELAHAAEVHGGFGSYRETLAAGIPVLVVPNQTDQPSNAELIQQAGLGLRVENRHDDQGRPQKVPPAELRERFDELMDRQDEIKANVDRIHEQMNELPSLGERIEGIAHALEVGDLEFNALKEPPADPGAVGGVPIRPRPDGPITITGPAGAAADGPGTQEVPQAPEVRQVLEAPGLSDASEIQDPPEQQLTEPEATEGPAESEGLEELAELEATEELPEAEVDLEEPPMEEQLVMSPRPADSAIDSEDPVRPGPLESFVESGQTGSTLLAADVSTDSFARLELVIDEGGYEGRHIPQLPHVVTGAGMTEEPAGPKTLEEPARPESEVALEESVVEPELTPADPPAAPAEPEELYFDDFDGP